MKLIEYIIKNDNKITGMEKVALTLGMDIHTFLLESYCPMSFNCVENTLYAKPTHPRKDDRTDCKYRYDDDFDKCRLCWERELLAVR